MHMYIINHGHHDTVLSLRRLSARDDKYMYVAQWETIVILWTCTSWNMSTCHSPVNDLWRQHEYVVRVDMFSYDASPAYGSRPASRPPHTRRHKAPTPQMSFKEKILLVFTLLVVMALIVLIVSLVTLTSSGQRRQRPHRRGRPLRYGRHGLRLAQRGQRTFPLLFFLRFLFFFS